MGVFEENFMGFSCNVNILWVKIVFRRALYWRFPLGFCLSQTLKCIRKTTQIINYLKLYINKSPPIFQSRISTVIRRLSIKKFVISIHHSIFRLLMDISLPSICHFHFFLFSVRKVIELWCFHTRHIKNIVQFFILSLL